jgi:hypothetical protein
MQLSDKNHASVQEKCKQSFEGYASIITGPTAVLVP